MKRILLFSLLFFHTIAGRAQIIIPANASWKYLDNGSDQGTGWRLATYSDLDWKSGGAELGYGDGDEQTVVNGGPATNRYITTYFRKKFSITNAGEFTGYTLRIRRDDGAVVYINGKEVFRTNMPAGTISYTTLASGATSGDGANYFSKSLSASTLVTGENIMAVEIHQSSTSSSDISFALELSGTKLNEVKYQWSGAIQPAQATVVAKMSAPSTTCRLVVSTSVNLSSPLYSGYSTASEAHNLMAKMNISGLTPGTKYYYAIQSNGVTDKSSDDIGTFTTPATGAFSFRFTLGACAVSSAHAVYTLMQQKAPLFHLATGDFHYANPNSSTDINVHRLPYERNMLSQIQSRNFLKTTALAYMWDDHDYCGNNSNSLSAGRTNARLAYQEYVPHYPLAAGAGNVPIYQAFTIGRVHFILSDLRSEKTGSTMMGSLQKSWFKQQCLYARDNNLMIAWVTPVSFGGSIADNWGGFAAERTELSDFFRDNNIRNMFLLSGDAHMIAIDNGTNHDFSTGQNNPNRYPVFQAAAVNNTGSVKGGTYSEGGTFPNPSATTGQYGLVEVTDEGLSSLTIKFTGYRTAENTTAESVLTSYTFTCTLAPPVPVVNSVATITLRTLNEGRQVLVAWNKHDHHTYTLERGKENRGFSPIKDIVAEQGSIIDQQPGNGWNTYRLIDKENKVAAQKAIFIEGKTHLQLVPNPAGTMTHIKIFNPGNASLGRYMIYDTGMKAVQQGWLQLSDGHNSRVLDISNLPAGAYYVRVYLNGQALTEKLIVQK